MATTVFNVADYRPPRWLRNGHTQSILGSSRLRQYRGTRALRATGAVHQMYEVSGGQQIRLQGLYSWIPGVEPRALALLLHGWEGSAQSSYMCLTAAQLLARGIATFRLNFRDHGDTHHLNEALFHSNRIDEVVHAAGDIAQRFGRRQLPLLAAGYSLGGNFVLRVALSAADAGLALTRVAAVCPVLDPADTMAQMEDGPAIYLRYFERRWRRSLVRKRALFPHRHDFDDATLRLGMRELTRWLVQRHTDFCTLDNYFAGYSIAGDRLSKLAVPADILMAEDDPVIPVAQFAALQLPDNARLHLTQWGGHCGFLRNARLDGYAESWVARCLAAALPI